MRRIVLASFVLAACAPQLPAPPPDPLAVRYEVRVGQSVLPNVRSVVVTGPDLELIEVRPGGGPGRLSPGRIGWIYLLLKTDWAAAERTVETWRAAIISPDPNRPPSPTHQTISITVTSRSGGAPATYTFLRCLPSEHQMQFAAQDSRIEQVWRVTCEVLER